MRAIREELYEERKKGRTYSELSKMYGMSASICRKWYEEEKIRKEMEKNDIFLALQAVNEDRGKNVRILNMLKRNGIETIEAFSALKKTTCRRFRNCGTMAIEIIDRAQAYLKTGQTDSKKE